MSLLDALPTHPAVASAPEIRRWKKVLIEGQSGWLAAAAQDTGRSEAELYLTDWLPLMATFDFLERKVAEVMAPRALRSGFPVFLGPRALKARRIPHGRVLIVGTWNYPFPLQLSQIFSAVAVGNRVSFKPSPHTPQLALKLEEVLVELLGPDRFEVLNIDPEPVLTSLRRGEFSFLIFTGGTQGAQAFAQAAAQALVPGVYEASGSESAIVLPGQKPEAAVDHLLWAGLHYSGQTCVAPRFCLVPREELDRYFHLACEALSDAKTLAGRAPLKHPGVREEHERWIHFLGQLPRAELFRAPARPDFALLKVPALSDLPLETPATFGPAMAWVGYENLGECLSWLRASPWSLLTTVWGEGSVEELSQLELLDATIVSWGEAVVASGDPSIAFGGRGRSGYGLCHGEEGLRQLSRVQTWQEVRRWTGLRPGWKNLERMEKTSRFLRGLGQRPFETAARFLLSPFMQGASDADEK